MNVQEARVGLYRGGHGKLKILGMNVKEAGVGELKSGHGKLKTFWV